VGSSTLNLNLCDQLFPCASTTALELLRHSLKPVTAAANANADAEERNRQAKTTCHATAALCPAVSISCALCGWFLPGTCGEQCIIGGIYCGVSGYSCAADSDTKRSGSMASSKHDDDEKRRKELAKFLFGGLADKKY
jgi:hypothetical protein